MCHWRQFKTSNIYLRLQFNVIKELFELKRRLAKIQNTQVFSLFYFYHSPYVFHHLVDVFFSQFFHSFIFFPFPTKTGRSTTRALNWSVWYEMQESFCSVHQHSYHLPRGNNMRILDKRRYRFLNSDEVLFCIRLLPIRVGYLWSQVPWGQGIPIIRSFLGGRVYLGKGWDSLSEGYTQGVGYLGGIPRG